ncbi:MAG TPA: HAD family hydrolase [Jatrophihabitans sp.]|nr:HAD family hydrolase [Jatrophihabitans sp.]
MSQPRGVLFDVDGTLVDTTYIHAVCWWLAFRKADLDVPMARIHRAVGMGADQLVPHVLNQDRSDIDELDAAHGALYSMYWPALRLLPGARDLVRHAHTAGLVTVLASSASPRELEVLRRLLDADDSLDHATSSKDAEDSKPAPDLVSAALEKAALDPAASVFVGDSVWDVEACAKAQVACIGLECGGTSAAELRAAGAIQTFEDPGDLLAHWDETMLGRAETRNR